MSPIRSLLLLPVFLAGALACAALPAQAAKPACRQASETVFVIDGATDPAMADCVAAALRPTTTELVLTSDGGSAAAALDIVDRIEAVLADRLLTVRVVGQCNSSCANYLIPLASRLVVEPGGLIAIHGGIDPAQIARIRASGDTAAAEKAQVTAERQLAFARRRGVRLGWLIYRGAERPTVTDYLSGAAEGFGQARMVIVEEALLRSCLPKVEVQPFQADLEARWLNPRRYAQLRKGGSIRSASLYCDEPAVSP